MLQLLAQTDLESVFGVVNKTPGIEAYDAASGGNIGLILFISTLIRVATVAAGIFVMINVILAGFDYITSQGDTGSHKKVKDRLTTSVIGLVLIVGSYTIAGLIGLIVFGDASYILNPQIKGPAEINTTTGTGGN